ncbi:EAL domain-containing protein [Cloacibacillus sp.]
MAEEQESSSLTGEIETLRRQLRYYQEYDQLTGIFNKAAFCKKCAELISMPHGSPFDVVCIDIERFKLVNDIYGMERGDSLLCHVARGLERKFGCRGGIIARIASDVFALLISHEAEGILESDILSIFKSCPVEMSVMPSIGVCRADNDTPVEKLCDWAVMALDSVKHNYMRHIAVYNSDIRSMLLEEQEILSSMESALEKKEFTIYFQPKCNMTTGKIIGVEALVRWVHPEKGVISPASFIPIFEKNGFIKRLDSYVWEEAAAWLRRLIDAGGKPLPVSVNISRTDFFGMDVCDTLMTILRRYDISPELLELEITESAYADRPQEIINTIMKLMNNRFTILMDDFGSGYSSLNMLKDIDVNVLKIDMGFLRRDSQKSRDILKSVVRMAKWLNLPMIAEGVETKDQVDFLLTIGCVYAQGYYYYRPMTAEQFLNLINAPEKMDYQNGGKLIPVQNQYLDFHELFNRDMMSDRLMGNILGAIAIYSFDGEKLYLLRGNEEYFKLLRRAGVTNDMAQDIMPTVAERDRPLLVKSLKQIQGASDEGSVEVTVRPFVGVTDFWIQMRLFHLAKKGEDEIYYAALADVTEQMEAIETLRISEQRFRLAMEATNIAIFELDVRTRVATYSEYTRKTFGLDATVTNAPEGFIEQGTVCEEYIDRFRGIYEAIYRGEKKASCVIRAILGDGKFAWNRVSLTAIQDRNGKTVKAIGIVERVPFDPKLWIEPK